MNINTLAALLNENITTVKVTLYNETRVYTYKANKEFAKTLKPGDVVMLETAHTHFQTGYVVSVDDESQLDATNPAISYRFIVGKVDMAALDEMRGEEQALVEKVINSERDRMREHLRQSFKEGKLGAQGIHFDKEASPHKNGPASIGVDFGKILDDMEAEEMPKGWTPLPKGFK